MAVETALGGDEEAALAALGAVEPAATVSPSIGSAEGYKGLKSEGEPKTFEIRGQTFSLVDELPGATMLDLALVGDPAATDFERLRGIRSFLDVAVDPEQNAAFQHVLRSSVPSIGMEELMKLIEQISETLTVRPTE